MTNTCTCLTKLDQTSQVAARDYLTQQLGRQGIHGDEEKGECMEVHAACMGAGESRDM